MHLKFLARGTGSARDAAGYLLGERDAAGKPREGVEVLRGNPDMVAAVADSLDFEHRYTSGVIAWAPDDQPTDDQIEAVLDAFEETTWAGLERDRYAWAAVLHREGGGGAHVHVLAARCDLETGRSLNIAPPGWRSTVDPLRDAFNHEHGWGRPDDPARARVQQPGHRAYVEAARLRAGLRLEASPRDLIRDYLLQRIEHGTVRNRPEVVAALREAGLEVPRQGKDYLTALDPETGDRWRLKGELYGEDFHANDLTERLRRRLENERREIEELTASELGRLAENSRRVARNALRTIERDTEEATGRMRELLMKAWLRPFVVGLGLWLGIFGGGWATMRWLSRSIQDRIERVAELDYDIMELPMSRGTLWSAFRALDIPKERMTMHGFRAMARTILDEVLGFRPDFIEHQLAHAVRDPNGRAYNRTAFLPQRRVMMQAWADYLDRLRAGKIEPGTHKAPGHAYDPTSRGMWKADARLVVGG